MLRSSRIWALALAAVVLLYVAHDAGRLQAHDPAHADSHAQICAALITDATQTSLRSDCEVLLDIKDTLRGTASLNWGAGTAFASWTGITSGTGASARVWRLQLRNLGLSGTIPARLGDLTGLIWLLLDRNDLTGSIPSELGDLTGLRYLYLYDNQLSGEIPSDLGGLSNLWILYLRTNQLSGSIPPELGNLSSLNELSIRENQLMGSIPSELGNLSALRKLWLSDNQLSGEIPGELGNLSHVDRLHLYSNQLTGSIPSELGNLSSGSQTELWLHDNQLTGSIPSELGDIPTLSSLNLSHNQLSGEIPVELATPNITTLYLNNNELTGEIPVEFVNTGLGRMTHLDVSHNRLTGEIPEGLLQVPQPEPSNWQPPNNLRHLDLSHNQLSGPIPTENGNVFTSLWHIDLSHNQLTGSFHRKLFGYEEGQGGVIYLEHLDLSNNRLSGSLPDLTVGPVGTTGSFRLPPNLRVLYLHNNFLTGELPNLRENAPYLTELGLGGGNDFGLNWEMFESDGILGLDAIYGNNSPADPLVNPRDDNNPSFPGGERDPDLYPDQIPANSLLALYLHQSGLEGTIPDWVGAQSRLRTLWLHDNSLTGSIEHFGGLTSIEDLRLHGNAGLTGGFNVVNSLNALTSLSFPASDGGLSIRFGQPTVDTSYYLDLRSAAASVSADPAKTIVYWTLVEEPDVEDIVEDNPPPYRVILSDWTIDIVAVFRNAAGEHVGGILSSPVTICAPVPAESVRSVPEGHVLALLRYNEDDGWTVLEPADEPSGYYPGAGNGAVCGATDRFSLFLPAVVDVDDPAVELPSRPLAYAPILRIEPSIRDVTVSQGDAIRLSFDIYGRQEILNNELGEGHVFTWDDGGAGGIISPTDRANTIIYTAPTSPGTHTVTVASPTGACYGGEDADERCTAKFTIKVRRPSAVQEERPAPKNPVGEIPSVLADAEGRQYEVLTPEEGGFFDGGGLLTLSAAPGVVPNLEILGVRVDAAGPASNVGMTAHRYTLVGEWYDVLAVDASETAISSYVLNSPLEVCVPLPPEARHDISDIALVADNPDGTLTVLSASVRIAGSSGVNVCGNLGTLPASVAVGTAGSPDAIPTPTPDPDEIADPDTGGRSLPTLLLLALMVLSGVVVATGVAGVVRGRRF